MEISTAQHDVRSAYLGGFAGQLVSGILWSISAALCTFGSFRSAVLFLVFSGFFIFPLTLLVLRLSGRSVSLPSGHPMNALAMQIAFSLPLTLPVVYGASVHHHAWFYPAFMIVLGAHYLPFTFLYGMRQFFVLGVLLISAGIFIGMRLPGTLGLGAWLTASLLLVFAFLGRRTALSERA
jgi:hypothetical protein